MNLKQYDGQDGRKVWLGAGEVDRLLSNAGGTERRIALGLCARSGLRAAEAIAVTPADVVDTPLGARVRVQHGKGDKYRETPLPASLATTVETYADLRDAGDDVPLVDRTTRTVERWVDAAAADCREETGDGEWRHLGPHDLRRTWGTLLVEAGVEPGIIMDWGGWSDWETFREHYLGAFSPEMQRREVAKVEWL